jgi:Icc-related predicted phosphoesterase
MKVVFISDTHGHHKGLIDLPDGDVICHTGDYSARGDIYDLRQFMKWFSALEQYKARIFISGNHDIFAAESPELMKDIVPDNVTYLFDSSVTIDGIKFYGTPWQPIFLDWAFNITEAEQVEKYALIPKDTDVLLTHCPPFGVLDLAPAWRHRPAEHVGSKPLRDRVLEVEPLVHAFGHIHEGYGDISLYNNITFINGSVLNGIYRLVNDPIISYIVK